jgi:hypothetical protein
MKKVSSCLVLLLLLSLSAFAQTTTYTVTYPSSGTWSTAPYRFFNIPFSEGARIDQLEISSGVYHAACANQTTPPLGFIFITLPGQTQSPCAPLTGAPGPNYGTFAGVDAYGIAFTGSYSLTISTARKCSGGRLGGCHTVYTITAGTLTITQ